MKFRVSCRIFLGLFFLLQLSEAGEKGQEKLALFMQKNVEQLIEKILSQVQEYYHEIKSNAKCIPDDIPDSIMMTLKKSIDCVSDNEKKYILGKIRRKAHMKNFLYCFAEAKREINETMKAIDPEEDYCPENVTEKTYQINVTTTFIKTFQISISNGLEVTHKEIDFSKDNCDDRNGDQNENENGENTTIDINGTNADYFNNSSAGNKDVKSTTRHPADYSFHEVSSVHHQSDDVVILGGFSPEHVVSSTHLETDGNFDDDNYSITTDHEIGGSFNVTSDITQDEKDSSTDIHSTINSYSPFIHSNKASSVTEDRSTQSIDDFTEIYHQSSNNVNLHSTPDVTYGQVDLSTGSANEEIEKYEQYKNNPEEDSLDEYSIEYDDPEENQQNSFSEIEENISNDYNINNFEYEDQPKEISGSEESSSLNSDPKDPKKKKAVLSNAGKKSLASDIYTQLKKLREEDDYYDMKNSGKLAFKSENEDFDEEENDEREQKKVAN